MAGECIIYIDDNKLIAATHRCFVKWFAEDTSEKKENGVTRLKNKQLIKKCKTESISQIL